MTFKPLLHSSGYEELGTQDTFDIADEEIEVLETLCVRDVLNFRFFYTFINVGEPVQGALVHLFTKTEII